MSVFPSSSKPAALRDSFHQHLHMSALAASAAGVSVLALAQPGKISSRLPRRVSELN